MEELTLTDLFAILRRWRKIFFITALSLFFITLVFARTWSNYRSTAVIEIDQPEVSSNATAQPGDQNRPTPEDLADQRISAIKQKVTSTASLADIITKFNLYEGARKHAPIGAIAGGMRKKIGVELITSNLAGGHSSNEPTTIAFNLSFDYGNPQVTQQVTDELASRFLDEDLKERRTETEDTSDFLGKQISTMETEMSEQEKKIADYQKEHGITGTAALAFNQQTSTSLMLSLQNLDSQITTNEGTLGALRAQLANTDPYSRVVADGQVMTSPSVQLKALQGEYASLSAQYGPDHPDVVKIRGQIEALQEQVGGSSGGGTSQLRAEIADTRTNLTAAQKTYGPDHPDVVALKTKLAKLEDQLATYKVHGGSKGIVGDADNPAYLQASSELRAAEEQHKALLEQRQQLENEQRTYQKAIAENPQVEKEMAALSRDYDNEQMRYRELKEKKMMADMQEQLQSDRKGQRLTLIDPPEMPLDTHPGRSILMLGGLILALLGGLAAVVIAQILSGSIVGAHHLETITGFAPLMAIPQILTTEEHKHSFRHRVEIACQEAAKRIAELTRKFGQPAATPADMQERESGE